MCLFVFYFLLTSDEGNNRIWERLPPTTHCAAAQTKSWVAEEKLTEEKLRFCFLHKWSKRQKRQEEARESVLLQYDGPAWKTSILMLLKALAWRSGWRQGGWRLTLGPHKNPFKGFCISLQTLETKCSIWVVVHRFCCHVPKQDGREGTKALKCWQQLSGQQALTDNPSRTFCASYSTSASTRVVCDHSKKAECVLKSVCRLNCEY